MRCSNLNEARKQAKANAKSSGKRWTVFTDTSGNSRAECYDGDDYRPDGSSAVGEYEIFDPPKPKQKYRFRSRKLAEEAEEKATRLYGMLRSALDDVLNGYEGPERGGNPVTFHGAYYTAHAMRPERCDGGFIMLVFHDRRSKRRPRKSATVYTPEEAKDCLRYMDYKPGSTPDADENNELMRVLREAINALPYA